MFVCPLLLIFTSDTKLPYYANNKWIKLTIGAYTPLTKEGNVMVNRIMVSCYAVSNHNLAHLMLAPMQWYPDIMVWIFGIEKESPGYISILTDLGGLMLPFNSLNIE